MGFGFWVLGFGFRVLGFVIIEMYVMFRSFVANGMRQIRIRARIRVPIQVGRARKNKSTFFLASDIIPFLKSMAHSQRALTRFLRP